MTETEARIAIRQLKKERKWDRELMGDLAESFIEDKRLCKFFLKYLQEEVTAEGVATPANTMPSF